MIDWGRYCWFAFSFRLLAIKEIKVIVVVLPSDGGGEQIIKMSNANKGLSVEQIDGQRPCSLANLRIHPLIVCDNLSKDSNK